MLRKIARPMLASFFVWDGVDTLRNTDQHVEETENMLARLRKVLPREYASFVPNDPELVARGLAGARVGADRKSTRLNSSHVAISYAVFCLKKKKERSTNENNTESQNK